MRDVLTLHTPIPAWWLADPDGDALDRALRAVIRDALADHQTGPPDEPELVDTAATADGAVWTWLVGIDHADTCWCRSEAPAPT